MAKKIKQFRWYGGDNGSSSHTDVANLTKESIIDGTAFKDYMPISQLGVQAPPGTDFYLNGSVRPIIVGVSGIYDLDIKNGARITSLKFSKQSLERINKNPRSYLIIDILYGEEEK